MNTSEALHRALVAFLEERNLRLAEGPLDSLEIPIKGSADSLMVPTLLLANHEK